MAKRGAKLSDSEKVLAQYNEYFLSVAVCEKYKPLIDNMSEGVIIEDKNHNILYANSAFSKIIGILQKDCAGRSIFDFINDENRKYYLKEVERGSSGHKPERYIEFITKNDKVNVLVGATPISKDCHIVIMSDLRDLDDFYKKLNIDPENYFRLVQNSYKEVGVIKRRLDYLSDLIDFASVDAPIAEIFNFIVSSIIAFTQADGCVFRLYNKSQKKFTVGYANGVNADWYNKKPIIYKGSLIEKAIKNGGILRVPDIQKENCYSSKELAKKNNFSSMITAPVDIKMKLLGYVSIYFKDGGAMQNIELDFLTLFLKQAAIAIEMNS